MLTHWVKQNNAFFLPIFLFQIRLQIKRSVARRNAGQISFKDRDVDDVVDGYVACEPYKDSHVWDHSQVMERAMQVILTIRFHEKNRAACAQTSDSAYFSSRTLHAIFLVTPQQSYILLSNRLNNLNKMICT